MSEPNIWDLSSEIVDRLAALAPVEATYCGVEGHDDEWSDFSPAGIQAKIDCLRAASAEIDQLPAAQDRWERQAVAVARDFIETELGRLENPDTYRELNTIWSPPVQIRGVFDIMNRESPLGRGAIVRRLQTLDMPLGGYRQTLEEGKRRGLLAPARQVRAAIEQNRIHAGPDSALHTVVASMRANGADDGEMAEAEAALRPAQAAFARFAAYLEDEYLPEAPVTDGIGEERYRLASAGFLGTKMDLAETYEWGWSEVGRIHAEMEKLTGAIGEGSSVGETITALNEDDRYSLPRDDFLAEMQRRQEAALVDLDGSQFDIPAPVHRIETRFAPAGGNLGAYYVDPSEDFTRPGSVWFSVGESERVRLWDNVSTAYHEGFPGHHLQLGIQKSLSDETSRLQRVWAWMSGSGEGWALFAERLMHELGYFEQPAFEFGKLASEMLRAVRVVVDLGLHVGYPIPPGQPFHPGEAWSFEAAVEMLTDVAGQLHNYAVDEVTRYLGWPGQAPAYKIGERVILELREELCTRQGMGAKEFHHRVLEAGAVGLDLMRNLVATGAP